MQSWMFVPPAWLSPSPWWAYPTWHLLGVEGDLIPLHRKRKLTHVLQMMKASPWGKKQNFPCLNQLLLFLNQFPSLRTPDRQDFYRLILSSIEMRKPVPSPMDFPQVPNLLNHENQLGTRRSKDSPTPL